MKLDEDYKKVMNELQENFGWSNIDILPESYQDLLNDTIMAVKNLTIQNVTTRFSFINFMLGFMVGGIFCLAILYFML